MAALTFIQHKYAKLKLEKNEDLILEIGTRFIDVSENESYILAYLRIKNEKFIQLASCLIESVSFSFSDVFRYSYEPEAQKDQITQEIKSEQAYELVRRSCQTLKHRFRHGKVTRFMPVTVQFKKDTVLSEDEKLFMKMINVNHKFSFKDDEKSSFVKIKVSSDGLLK